MSDVFLSISVPTPPRLLGGFEKATKVWKRPFGAGFNSPLLGGYLNGLNRLFPLLRDLKDAVRKGR